MLADVHMGFRLWRRGWLFVSHRYVRAFRIGSGDEAVVGGYDGFGGVVAGVSSAHRRRADVYHQCRDFVCRYA